MNVFVGFFFRYEIVYHFALFFSYKSRATDSNKISKNISGNRFHVCSLREIDLSDSNGHIGFVSDGFTE